MKDSVAEKIRALADQYIQGDVRTDWPDEELAELLDAAQTHLTENRPDQAICIWKQLVRAGGEEGDWGHLEYADYLLRLGQEEEAVTELAALMAGRRVAGLPWLLAAELLEDRGMLEEALFWYSAGAGCQPAGLAAAVQLRQLREGRRRLRWALEIPLDDDDLLAEMSRGELDDKVFDLLDLLAYPQVRDGRLQFWDRAEVEEGLRGADPPIPRETANAYYWYVELVLRACSGGRPTVVPRRPNTLMPVLAVALAARSRREIPSMTGRHGDEGAVEWPPGRNQACWCGSGTKYKRCCGAYLGVA
ncbi:SEC-C metal-binding domain-containing protein [Kribbella monticola]|uniref:SEC-C metal-binding domain-containing protein n=1 Tax=Kribbella monticola TaxID=2185285 RepID=UPI0018E51133|nr:SEC-C domain-containing protein [Kribbella monticola]